MKNLMDDHMKNKMLACSRKNLDKEKSKSCQTLCAATYNLQHVLTTQRLISLQLYYRRKLGSHNLTVYDIDLIILLCMTSA